MKLCDVFPDGTSALVSRGTLDLAFRGGTDRRAPLVPGEVYDVDLVLDACAYRLVARPTLRVSVAGSDWPNTVAPPAPGHAHRARRLGRAAAVAGGDPVVPRFVPGSPRSSEDPEGVVWSVTRDVLRRTTSCAVRSGSVYDIPHGGTAGEEYVGEVVVDRRTFAQRADATTTFTLRWDDVDVRVTSTMRVEVGAAAYDVAIDTDAFDGGHLVSHREWRESIPR